MDTIFVKQFHNSDLQTQELDKCLKRLKKELDKEKILTEVKERQFYKKPSEKRREKEKMIASLMKKRQRKKDLWEAKWGDTKFVARKPETPSIQNSVVATPALAETNLKLNEKGEEVRNEESVVG